MRYEVNWAQQPLKFLKKIDKQTAQRIFEKIEEVATNPLRYLKSFQGQKVHKLRIGKYRALIDVNQNQYLLTVQVLDERGRIYK